MTQQEHDVIDREFDRLKSLLAEKDAEIERLKTQHEEMLIKHAREQNVALESFAGALAEIDRLKAEVERLNKVLHYWGRSDKELLSRAADALEEEFGEPILEGRDLSNKSPWNLIIELRKAAE